MKNEIYVALTESLDVIGEYGETGGSAPVSSLDEALRFAEEYVRVNDDDSIVIYKLIPVKEIVNYNPKPQIEWRDYVEPTKKTPKKKKG